jgi:hypothetical protein
MKKILSFLLVIAMLSGCSDNNTSSETGPITLEFDNVVGTSNLQLNTSDTPYTNSKGEVYKLTSLTYYVSNIELKRDDGTVYTDPIKSDGSLGYYLIDENDASSQEITLENVPSGNYTEVTFTIGVDASQVDQGAQTGVLDPAKGFFWSWNSGYIFMVVEGVSPASAEDEHVFQYHIGGYKSDPASNQVNNVRTVTLSFNGDSAPVRAQHQPEVHLLFDVNKFLDGAGEKISFTSNASRHSPKACEKLADNILTSFVVDHIHAN